MAVNFCYLLTTTKIRNVNINVNNWRWLFHFNPHPHLPKKKTTTKKRGTWGLKVLHYWAFFLSNISVTLILLLSIAVSSSPVVCDFLSFWLMVLGIKKKIFEDIVVVFICPLLPDAGQYFYVFRLPGKWLNNFWQLFYDEISKAPNDQAFW